MHSNKDLDTTIALHGSYYGHNFGDILLMALFTSWIKENNGGLNVELPFATKENTIFISADDNNKFKSLEKAKALIYGGGGYFGEPSTGMIKWGFRNLARHLPAGAYMRLKNKPYAIIGVGVGPITNIITRKAVVQLCRHAKVLAVRDEESKNYLIEYGVDPKHIHVTADAVLAMTKDYISADYFSKAKERLVNLKKDIKIGVHVTGFPNKEAISTLKNEIVLFSKRNPDVGIVLLTDVKGVNVHSGDLKKEIGVNSIEIPYEGPEELTAMLGMLDMVITTKLHVGITATALGKLVLSFPGHPKTLRFFNQINKSDLCKPLWELKEGDAINLISNNINRISENHFPPQELVDKAKKNKELLQEFLKDVL